MPLVKTFAEACKHKKLNPKNSVPDVSMLPKDYETGAYYNAGSQPRGYGTEAQARAAMLIYLMETDVLTAEEVNKRLAA